MVFKFVFEIDYKFYPLPNVLLKHSVKNEVTSIIHRAARAKLRRKKPDDVKHVNIFRKKKNANSMKILYFVQAIQIVTSFPNCMLELIGQFAK